MKTIKMVFASISIILIFLFIVVCNLPSKKSTLDFKYEKWRDSLKPDVSQELIDKVTQFLSNALKEEFGEEIKVLFQQAHYRAGGSVWPTLDRTTRYYRYDVETIDSFHSSITVVEKIDTGDMYIEGLSNFSKEWESFKQKSKDGLKN